MRKIIFAILILSFSSAQAGDIGLSVRALGMGNAYTAVVNDHDSLYYNPAGYARMSGFTWTIMDPAFGINNPDSISEVQDIADDSSDMVSLLNRLYGDSVTAYMGLKHLFSIGGFTFGGYGIGDLNFLLNNPAFPNLETSYRVDYGFVLGWGFEIMPKMLDTGLQVRRVTRQGGDIPIGVSTIATLDAEDIESILSQTGTGYAFDVGLNFKIPSPMNATLSWTWRDMGDTTFDPTGNTAAPPTQRSEQIIGLGMDFDSTLFSFRTAIDYRHLGDSDMQVGKKINMGVELGFPMLDVRAGLHQGYYTLGASFDLSIMRIDAATYGVELGEYPGQLEDRRYMVQMTIELGLDPGTGGGWFNMNSEDIKKSRRKQRR